MNDSMSPADIAAVTRNDGGFGGDGNGAWWLIVLFLFAFGRGGWGFGGGSGDGAASASEVQRGFDLQTVTGTLNGIENSIINGFDRITNYTNQGFAGLNTVITTDGYETRNAITQSTIAGMQNTNALSSQLAQCCCDNKAAIADVNYNIATQACAIKTADATNTRDIIDNQNANARAILDALAAQQTEALKTRISEQQAEINALQLAASQSKQNSYLIDRLQPTPIPAFPASQLYGYYGGCGCGCNNNI